MRKIAKVAVNGVLLLGLLPTVAIDSPQKAYAAASTSDALFNNVRGSRSAQDTLMTKVKQVIAKAPKRTTITIVMFLFDRLDIAKILRAAARRGVRVKLLGDRFIVKKAPYKMLKGLKNVEVIIYKPRYKGQLMHEKFMLVVYPNGSNLLLMGSNNFSERNASKEWNDLIVLKNVPAKVVKFLRGEYAKLKKGKLSATAGGRVSSGKIAVFTTPEKSSSLYLGEMLNRVKCKGGTRLSLATLHFGDSRVAEKLWRHHNNGCKVRVMINYDARKADKDGVGTNTLKWLKKKSRKYGRIALYNAQRAGAVKNHFKFLTVQGYFDGKKQGVVWTGSLHPSPGSQLNAQIQVRIKDGRLATKYGQQFDRMINRRDVSRI